MILFVCTRTKAIIRFQISDKNKNLTDPCHEFNLTQNFNVRLVTRNTFSNKYFANLRSSRFHCTFSVILFHFYDLLCTVLYFLSFSCLPEYTTPPSYHSFIIRLPSIATFVPPPYFVPPITATTIITTRSRCPFSSHPIIFLPLHNSALASIYNSSFQLRHNLTTVSITLKTNSITTHTKLHIHANNLRFNDPHNLNILCVVRGKEDIELVGRDQEER